MNCPYCHYEWKQRTEKPKKCPACQRWLIKLPLTALFLLACVLFLPACAHWEGRSQSDLIKYFGLPNQQMTNDSGTIYQYILCDEGNVTVPLSGPLGTIAVNTGTSCKKRLFLVKDDKVTKDLGTIK